MAEQLGDAPIEPAYADKMKAISFLIDGILNGAKLEREVGFVLLVFPFNSKDGRCNYISNGADRKDIIKLFREQIKRFKGER